MRYHNKLVCKTNKQANEVERLCCLQRCNFHRESFLVCVDCKHVATNLVSMAIARCIMLYLAATIHGNDCWFGRKYYRIIFHNYHMQKRIWNARNGVKQFFCVPLCYSNYQRKLNFSLGNVCTAIRWNSQQLNRCFKFHYKHPHPRAKHLSAIHPGQHLKFKSVLWPLKVELRSNFSKL